MTTTGSTLLGRGTETDAALRRLAALLEAEREGRRSPPSVRDATEEDRAGVPDPPWTAGAGDRARDDGDRPERVRPATVDLDAWDDPPWWRRVRWAPDKVAGVALVVVVLALGGVAVHRLASAAPGPETPVPQLPSATPGVRVPGVPDAGGVSGAPVPGAPQAGPLVVSVVGFVERSGLVTLAPGARVADALHAAGGVRPGGDREGLNLARPVADGEQILVGVAPGPDGHGGPRSGIVGPSPAAPAPGGPAGAPPAGSPAAPGAGAPGPAGALVDLNRADAAQLDTLPGVGPATAAAILSWRASHGNFTSVDQLAEVDGIGPATLAKLRPNVTV